MKRKAIILLICVFCARAFYAQNPQKMHSYDFDGALSEYRDSLENCTDSLRRVAFLKAARCAENGISLTEYCHRPPVVARRRFHKNEFFLYYPLRDKAWHPVKNDSCAAVVYDVSGARDTLCLDRRDSLRLFTMVCGKERYFASQDLYGMGGYDIYVESWDDETGRWSEPRNVGFPYSSPFNDYLFINTEDGKFSIFASDRDCPADSVNVYVLEYEPNPIHSAVSSPAELREMAALNPPAAADVTVPASRDSGEPDERTRVYVCKVAEVRACRREIACKVEDLDRMREAYSVASEEEKPELEKTLMEGELALTAMRAALDKLSGELRDIEMDFLLNGGEIRVADEPEEAEPGAPKLDFKFVKKELGAPLFVKFQ